MKAISLRQPWPWALLKGGCDIITQPRSMLQGYRGDLLIHAGKRLADREEIEWLLATSPESMAPIDHPGIVETAQSGFVGVVTVDSTHHSSSCKGICSEWTDGPGWHSRITQPRILPKKIPGFGQVGLFTPAPAVLRIVGGGA